MKPEKFKSGIKLMAEVCGTYPITPCLQFLYSFVISLHILFVMPLLSLPFYSLQDKFFEGKARERQLALCTCQGTLTLHDKLPTIHFFKTLKVNPYVIFL